MLTANFLNPQITDLPPGRIPIETCIIEGSESGFSKVYQVSLFSTTRDTDFNLCAIIAPNVGVFNEQFN